MPEPELTTLQRSAVHLRNSIIQRDINDVQVIQTQLTNYLRVVVQPSGDIHEVPVAPNEDIDTALRHMDMIVCSTGHIAFEDNTRVCNNCDRTYVKEYMKYTADTEEWYCESCAEDLLAVCDNCGDYYYDTDQIADIFDDGGTFINALCEHCYMDNRNIHWSDDNERYEMTTSQSSIRRYYNPDGILAQRPMIDCIECQDSSTGMCPRHLKQQAKELEDEVTHLWVYDTKERGYHAQDHNRFKTTKYRQSHEHPYLYYGIELEVIWPQASGLDKNRIIKDFIKATGGLFVAEFDRSVEESAMLNRSWGTEFISRPLSYKKWIEEDTITKLNKGMKVLTDAGAVIEQNQQCGLHIHMSKAFFEKNTKKSVKDIKNDMDWFFQFYQPEIEVFARRKYTQYCASKAYRMRDAAGDFRGNNSFFGIKGKIQLEKGGGLTVSQGSGITHHDCIVETRNTIEARVFQSTLDVPTILASIEFCRGLAHTARNKEGLTNKTFGEILFSKDTKYLEEYTRKVKMPTDRKMKSSIEIKI